MTPLPFTSPKALLARAEKHIAELEEKWAAFHSGDAYRVVVETDTRSGETVFKVLALKPIPDELACIVFDAVNCLRSALDHAVYASTIVITGQIDPKGTKFPFADNLPDAEAQWKRSAPGVPVQIRKFLLGFKPYKGCGDQRGDETLWGLNKVRNSKIHQILAPMVTGMDSVSIGGPLVAGARYGVKYMLVNRWDSVKGELEAFRIKDAESNLDIRFTVGIAFTEASHMPKAPVLATLRQLLGKVQGITHDIEAETIRLCS